MLLIKVVAYMGKITRNVELTKNREQFLNTIEIIPVGIEVSLQRGLCP
jgi:hypothetical protein